MYSIQIKAAEEYLEAKRLYLRPQYHYRYKDTLNYILDKYYRSH